MGPGQYCRVWLAGRQGALAQLPSSKLTNPSNIARKFTPHGLREHKKMHQTPKWPVKICTDLKSPQCYTLTSAPQQAKFAPRYTKSAPH